MTDEMTQLDEHSLQRYSSAPNPSISRHSNLNVFFTDIDLLVRKSFNAALQWGNKSALVSYTSNMQEQESSADLRMV